MVEKRCFHSLQQLGSTCDSSTRSTTPGQVLNVEFSNECHIYLSYKFSKQGYHYLRLHSFHLSFSFIVKRNSFQSWSMDLEWKIRKLCRFWVTEHKEPPVLTLCPWNPFWNRITVRILFCSLKAESFPWMVFEVTKRNSDTRWQSFAK